MTDAQETCTTVPETGTRKTGNSFWHVWHAILHLPYFFWYQILVVPETGTSYLAQVSWVSVISISMESTTVVVVVVVVHRGVNQCPWGQPMVGFGSTTQRCQLNGVLLEHSASLIACFRRFVSMVTIDLIMLTKFRL